jgi:hypothetical protein
MNDRVPPGQLCCVAAALAAVLFSVPVFAQAPAPPSPNGSDKPSRFRGVGATLGKAFAAPIHPVVQGVASGGGIGAGIGYDHPSTSRWQISTKAVATIRRYWLLEFDSEYIGDRVEGGAYGRVRDMSRLNFFGAGPGSTKEDWTTFTLRDPLIGAHGAVRLLPAVAIGGRVEELWPRVEGGRHPVRPSIETRFGDADAPGLAQQPRFGRYQTFVQVTPPAADGWGLNQGGAYRVSYDIFDDQQLDRFDFHRVQFEGRHRFAGFRPYHTLSFRGWVSSAEARTGHQVPFYLQHTIGGTSNIRSLHEAPLGGDYTAATLRAFANHRFRDNHLVLLQSEYRWSLWGPVDATVFLESGKAVNRRSELNLSDLKSDYGFSLNLVRATGPVARIDFGFGGGEGSRVFISLGGLLP